jgi:predicted nucleotidyltransferase
MKQNRVPNIIIALQALGEILASQGEHAAVVVVGGTALIMQGFVTRATKDVDVIAISRDPPDRKRKAIEIPEPLPESLFRAIKRVARDYNLPDDWMNTTVGLLWKTGLPSGFEERIHWEQYDGLSLGLADRYDLILLKLYAAADSEGPSSVHYQDLIALQPTNEELDSAARWIRSQDPSALFARILDQVLEHAKSNE